jgi:hypothetical protein
MVSQGCPLLAYDTSQVSIAEFPINELKKNKNMNMANWTTDPATKGQTHTPIGPNLVFHRSNKQLRMSFSIGCLTYNREVIYAKQSMPFLIGN